MKIILIENVKGTGKKDERSKRWIWFILNKK